MNIFSLDVSASSTGWAFTGNGKEFEFGTIVTKAKNTRAERLVLFAEQLQNLLQTFHPDLIVIEDTFSGINVKTMKMLCEFAGVAKYVCKHIIGIEPYVISNSTVKSFFSVAKKEQLFYFVAEILEIKDLTFKKHNDIIDAIAQLMCFSQDISNTFVFRMEKEYGYLYTNTTK